MRFLLIGDTHGQLGVINELAARTQADAVIHAGDFGFYDDGSYERLSERELRLHVAHSDLPQAEKDRILALPHGERTVAAKAARLLGEFQSYIDGGESFRAPVYAVWGNHEDKDVVERVFRGEIEVGNFHVLYHRRTYRAGCRFQTLTRLAVVPNRLVPCPQATRTGLATAISHTTSGRRSITWRIRSAASLGRRMPCSQLCTAFAETLSTAAKYACDIFNRLRRAATCFGVSRGGGGGGSVVTSDNSPRE